MLRQSQTGPVVAATAGQVPKVEIRWILFSRPSMALHLLGLKPDRGNNPRFYLPKTLVEGTGPQEMRQALADLWSKVHVSPVNEDVFSPVKQDKGEPTILPIAAYFSGNPHQTLEVSGAIMKVKVQRIDDGLFRTIRGQDLIIFAKILPELLQSRKYQESLRYVQAERLVSQALERQKNFRQHRGQM